MRTKHARIYLWLADRCRTDEVVFWYAFYAAMLMKLSRWRRPRQRADESARYTPRRRLRSASSPKPGRVVAFFARRRRSPLSEQRRSSSSVNRPRLSRLA
jgi:hypothetical protein